MRTMGAYVSLYDQLRQHGCTESEACESTDWVMCWDLVKDKVGREPTWPEVERTYRSLWGGDDDPADRVRWHGGGALAARRGAEGEGVSGVGGGQVSGRGGTGL